jgi:hypothetical protein
MTYPTPRYEARRLRAVATVLATCAWLLSCLPPASAQRVVLPAQKSDEIPKALRAALAASARGLIDGVGDSQSLDTVRAEALDDFNRQLDFVAPLIDDGILKALNAQSGPDIETVLLAIAKDRAARPEAYAELCEEFSKKKAAVGFLGTTARLHPPYDTEEWRLAWEYTLLAPSSGPVAVIAGRRGALPLDALAKIGNEASLPVITHRFRVAVTSAQCFETDATECSAILRVLGKFPSRRGVESMLECVNAVEAFQETIGRQVRARATKQQTYRDLALDLFSRPKVAVAAKTVSWEAALREFPTADLSKKDRDLIEAALATFAEPPK